MAKILISDLAKEVAKKHKLPQKETEQFIANMFAVVAEGLQQDKLVKVKGLGTFKVTQVKPRESVDVNTGERVLISGHDKVTFTPDSLMKELVNKPFAQFETVVINGDVDFAAIDAANPTVETEDVTVETEPADDAAVADELTNEPEEVQAEPKEVTAEPEEIAAEPEEPSEEQPQEAEPMQAVEQEGIAQPASTTVESGEEAPKEPQTAAADAETESEDGGERPVVSALMGVQPEPVATTVMPVADGEMAAPSEATPAPSVEAPATYLPERDEQPADEPAESEPSRRNLLLPLLAAVIMAMIGFAAGYFVGKGASATADGQPQVVARQDSAAAKTQADSAQQAKPAVNTGATAAPAATGETLEAMNNDSRVKLGAYRIEGIDTVITLGSGQTMERYCRTQGGGSGFLVYYQVVNGVDSLGEGAKMKVPKLSLKKRK
ncbi:MAG: HU family DNA-binding protein [Prevotella sp.]|nr:HU family DNA-binding protein [Prevotella sp.]